MTQEEKITQLDRMRYTKDKLSANLVLTAIVFDALYFVSVYQSDVGTYFYNWQTGASIIYNLVFMLGAFLASEGVKNRQSGYTGMIVVLGIMQFVRIFYIPTMAHNAVVVIADQQIPVMGDGQFAYLVACLCVSGVCLLVSTVTSLSNNRKLAAYMRTIHK